MEDSDAWSFMRGGDLRSCLRAPTDRLRALDVKNALDTIRGVIFYLHLAKSIQGRLTG